MSSGGSAGGSSGMSSGSTSSGASATGGASASLPSGVTAEQLVGKEVKSAQNESIGEIEDIVGTSGASKQPAVSVGGFLGVGDRQAAGPLRQHTVAGRGDDQRGRAVGRESEGKNMQTKGGG